ncbi:MAG TPA: S9 family peptidase [Virgibacillus sp.]|nr:S9 family peptidase [Virgibacillus sp.]
MNSSLKRAITAEDLTGIEVLSDPQFTPDGKTYTYITTTINEQDEYESHIFSQNLLEKHRKKWTFGHDKNSLARFSPDGKNLVFQSNRSGLPQLWLLDANGGEARQITFFKNGATSPSWSSDGKHIIFSASLDRDDDVQSQTEQSKEEREKEHAEKKKQPLVINRLKYKSDANGFHDEKRNQLILYDMENERFEQLTTADADHTFEDFSPETKSVLFSANLNEDADAELTNDLFLFNLSNKEVTKLTNGKGTYGNATFSPSGEKIACFGHEFAYSGATLTALYIFDVITGERTCLSETWDMQLSDAMIGDTRLGLSTTGPAWSKDADYLFFIGTNAGTTGLYQADLNGMLTVLYKEENHVFGFSYDKYTDAFVLGISKPTDPCNFYLLKNKSDIEQLTNVNAKFVANVHLSEPETITVPTDDGRDIQGWLLKPYGFQTDKKYPMVLEIHGGPHAMYGLTFFHELQLLAAKGYVVLYTNPRGSHGYGQEFVDACRADYGGGDYSDLMHAVDYALQHYHFIDEKRLGVTGGSYGGFMTNWIVSHTNRFKAAVTQRSISNWLSFYGVSDIGYFFTKWELGKNLLEDPKKLWEFSPLKYAENVQTPLLILHGEQDLRCPVEQGEQLFITLKHLGKNVEFVRFPDVNHELSRSGKPEIRIARLNHICRWFEEYL